MADLKMAVHLKRAGLYADDEEYRIDRASAQKRFNAIQDERAKLRLANTPFACCDDVPPSVEDHAEEGSGSTKKLKRSMRSWSKIHASTPKTPAEHEEALAAAVDSSTTPLFLGALPAAHSLFDPLEATEDDGVRIRTFQNVISEEQALAGSIEVWRFTAKLMIECTLCELAVDCQVCVVPLLLFDFCLGELDKGGQAETQRA